MNAYKHVIYENSLSNFKISADINFRGSAINPNGEKYNYNLIKNNEDYVTARPKVSLTLSYFEKNLFPDPSIFIGMRDIKALKESFLEVLERAQAPDLFVDVSGEKIINAKYAAPIIFRTSSSTKDNWISFTLCLGSFSNNENDIVLGVMIELSKAESKCSAMPITEFSAVYDIISDFSLTQFSLIMTAAELCARNPYHNPERKQPNQQQHYQNYQPHQYNNQQQNNNGYQQQNWNNNYSRPNGNYQQPTQQNFRTQQTPSYVKPATNSGVITSIGHAQQNNQPRYNAPQQPAPRPVAVEQPNVQPRSRMDAMEDTSIDEFDINDNDALTSMLSDLELEG